jgi:exoribonuclease R
MLPLDLSYDITSFVEGKDRPSFVFEMTFENADSGIIVEVSFY